MEYISLIFLQIITSAKRSEIIVTRMPDVSTLLVLINVSVYLVTSEMAFLVKVSMVD